MNKLKYIAIALLAFTFASCEDELETLPSAKVSEEQLLTSADGAQTVLNGVYRMMYTSGWGNDWEHENSGIMAFILAGDLMAEDHLMNAAGQGWFFYDYTYGIRSDYTHKAGRQYHVWNFFYTMASNANKVIAKKNALEGEDANINGAIGQAYAVRAFAYYNLINFFQQSINLDNTLPGIPLYTEPTTINTEGKPRGKISEVYALINSDIDTAIARLESANTNGWEREHASYINCYVAYGLKARIALAQNDFQGASAAAKKAIQGASVVSVNEFKGCNNRLAPNTLWGIEVIASQSEHFAGFFSHMDASVTGMYATKAHQCISSWLYKQIPATDSRRAWWKDGSTTPVALSESYPYNQVKFLFANPITRTGDYILMRAEEMVLIAAEAECHLGNYTEARELMKELGEKRMDDYEDRLNTFTDANTYNLCTYDPLATLMDEILFQRRVELWSEVPRIFDLKRLGLQLSRNFETPKNNHVAKYNFPANNKYMTLWIPQAEIDGNDAITEDDQNL